MWCRKYDVNRHVTSQCARINTSGAEKCRSRPTNQRGAENQTPKIWQLKGVSFESKHTHLMSLSLLKLMTCFGPCTGPYSGHKIYKWGDCTVWIINTMMCIAKHDICLKFNEISFSFNFQRCTSNDEISLKFRYIYIHIYIYILFYNSHYCILYRFYIVLLYTWVRESNLIIFQQDATVFSLLHFCRQLYMFRLLTPIIRSWYSCNYSFWYWLAAMSKIRCC